MKTSVRTIELASKLKVSHMKEWAKYLVTELDKSNVDLDEVATMGQAIANYAIGLERDVRRWEKRH